MNSKSIHLATDLGGVIRNSNGIRRGSQYSYFNPDRRAKWYRRVKQVPGALEALRTLKQSGVALDVVSKIDLEPPFVLRRLKQWLRYQRVHRIIPKNRWHFCQEWVGKRAICETIQPDIFIDDRLVVHQHLVDVVEHLILLPTWAEGQDEHLQYLVEGGRIKRMHSWLEIVEWTLALK